jgi:UDP-GlcNAc:undecaprenyl-phosphate/decaprenyl-phosphate GlcNAc-1-phosphate transferase
VTGGGWQYLAVFAVSAAFSLVLTPLVLRFALSRAVLDHPGGHKSHTDPVPYLGGLAIVGAFALTVGVAALVRPPVSGRGELFAVLGLAVLLATVGLLDDLRGLSPAVRLVVEVAAGFVLWKIGAGVDLFGPGATDALVTIVWVVGITNAFNLLDNMDGLSAGVAAIAAGSIFVIAQVEGQFLVAALAAALAGCALGFLRHNFHPARIYMGDAGSLYLGFVLAYLGLKLRFSAPDDITFLVPVLVLGVPILDTTLVTITRLQHGRSPFQGGRDHISHRLVKLGLPVRAAVGTIYVGAASLGVIALVVSRVDRTSAYLLAGLVLVLGILAGLALGQVPVYDDAASWGSASDVDAEDGT